MFNLSSLTSIATNLLLLAVLVVGLIVIRSRTSGRVQLLGTLAMLALAVNVLLGSIMTVVAPRLFRARLSWVYSASSLGLWLLTIAGTVLSIAAICVDRRPAGPPPGYGQPYPPGPYGSPGQSGPYAPPPHQS